MLSEFYRKSARGALPRAAGGGDSDFHRTFHGDSAPSAAKQAWRTHTLMEHAMQVQSYQQKRNQMPRSVPVAVESLDRLRALESGVAQRLARQEFAHPGQDNHRAQVEHLLRYCTSATWKEPGHNPEELLSGLPSERLHDLCVASVLADHFKEGGYRFDPVAPVVALFDGLYNCTSVTIATLHLLSLAGVTDVQALTLANHVTTFIPFGSGQGVFFNNGRGFLPADYFDRRHESNQGYALRHNDVPRKAWTALASVHMAQMRLFREQEEFVSAQREGDYAVALLPNQALVHFKAAKIFLELKRDDLAREKFLMAARLNPIYTKFQKRAAQLMLEQGDPEAARAHLLSLLEGDPQSATEVLMLLQELGDPNGVAEMTP